MINTALKYFYDYFLTNWSFKIRIKTDIKKLVNDYSRLDNIHEHYPKYNNESWAEFIISGILIIYEMTNEKKRIQ